MDKKQLLIGAAVVAILGAGAYYFSTQPDTTEPNGDPQGETNDEAETTTYHSETLGLSFEYPMDYTLTTHENNTLALVETSVAEDYQAQGAMEGPPSITLQMFDNAAGSELEEWIRTTPQSNFQLATEDALLEGEVGGEPARAYEHGGLYESNTVVVAHAGKIYLFTVGWMSMEDRNLHEFGHLLDSVTFD